METTVSHACMDDGSCFCFERDLNGEGCGFVDDYVSDVNFKPADRRDLCVLQLPTLQLNDPLDSLSHFVMGMWKRFRNDSYSVQKYGQSKVSDAKLSQGYEALYKFALKSAFIRFCDMETPEYVKDNGRLVLQITNFNTVLPILLNVVLIILNIRLFCMKVLS